MVNSSKMQEIRELFENYHKKHNILMTLDGVVDEKDKNILFILKESNISRSKNIELRDFWFKNVFENKIKNKYYEPKNVGLSGSEKMSQTKYFNCISTIKDLINKDFGIFYININKEGGVSKSDGKKINRWLTDEEKRNFLIKQINILAPDKVVVFSASTIGSSIDDILHEANILDKDIIRANFHPSRYSNKGIKELL